MPFTEEQEGQATAEISNLSDARERGDKAKEIAALESLKKLFVSMDKMEWEDMGGIDRISKTRNAFNALLQKFHIENEKAYAIIKLMLDIHSLFDRFARYGEARHKKIYRAAVLEDMDCFQLLAGTYNDCYHATKDALYLAANNRQIDAVKFLVAQGADINATRDGGETPLAVAVKSNATDVVKYLLTCGADVHVKDAEGRTLLCIAANYFVGMDILRMLIEHTAEVNIEDRNAALKEAVKWERIDSVRVLLENGGWVNKDDLLIDKAVEKQISALLDDYEPRAAHPEIDSIFVEFYNHCQPRILQEALSKSHLLIPPLVNIIASYARLKEDITPDDKSVQKGPAISRIQYVKEKLKDLIKWHSAKLITEYEQGLFIPDLLHTLKSSVLNEECRVYWEQLEDAQDLDAVVPPWELFRAVPKVPSLPESKESKEVGATSTTTTSGQSSPDHLEMSEAKEVTAEAKKMPSVSSNQIHRSNEPPSNIKALRTSGVGFHSDTVAKAEGKPKVPDAPQKAKAGVPPQQESDAGSSGPKPGQRGSE